MTKGWYPISQALTDLESRNVAAPWPVLRRWIGDGELPVRGEIDGVPYSFVPEWIGFLAKTLDEDATPPLRPMPEVPPLTRAPQVETAKPDGDSFFFDLEKAAKHKVQIGPGRSRWMMAVEVDYAALSALLRSGRHIGEREKISNKYSIIENTRGPRPKKRQLTAREMVKDYSEKPEVLQKEKEETLRSRYGVSRDTARKARADALSEMAQAETPTK